MSRLPLTLSLLCLPLLLSCEDEASSCTQIGCTDGFTASITKTSGTWDAGAYEFEIEVDGTSYFCSVDLPFESETTTADCDSDLVWLGTSGSALDESEHEIVSVGTTEVAAIVFVTVRLDGTALTYMTWEPEYDRQAPNGEDCGPICYTAEDVLVVP
jgi:hypothetical protein